MTFFDHTLTLDASRMSSDACTRPSKRQRTENEPVSALDVKKHGRLWFEVGNTILVANDGLGFRLHRGILSLHSEVFRDILSFPSSVEDNEMMEGCPVLRLQDCGEDLDLFFTLLHDGVNQ